MADTVRSLRLVKKHMTKKGAESVKVAAIYYEPWSVIVPEYEKTTKKWIVFPWERKETVRCLVRNCEKEGIPIERAKEKLVEGRMDHCLVERFINEVLEEERQ